MTKYAGSYLKAAGPGDSRPTALQVIKDYGMEGKLVGKIAVVTGASSGIGVETVRALATTGLKFFLPSRNPDKVKTALGDSFNPESMVLVSMDQTSLKSVRSGARDILSQTDKVNILINNAGIMGVPEVQLTEDGFELQFATNHLSHFLLFHLLKPALLAGSTPEFNSRVVVVSAAAYRDKILNESDNYNFEKGGYVPWLAYAHSKRANIYMANEIERRYGSQGIHATSLHPGVIASGLARFLNKEQAQAIFESPRLARYWKTPEQGAATTVWAAIGPEWEGRGGRYLSECEEAPPGKPEEDDAGAKYTAHTYEPELEARLWKDSLKMVGLADDM